MKRYLVFIITIVLFGSCSPNSPFQESESEVKGWRVYETEFVRFELPSRYVIDLIITGDDSITTYDKVEGTYLNQKTDFPELMVSFYDGKSCLLFHYSCRGTIGPTPEKAHFFEDSFHFEEDTVGRYAKRQYVNTKFENGEKFGGVYLGDTSNYFNDVLVATSNCALSDHEVDLHQSPFTLEELERISNTLKLKK